LEQFSAVFLLLSSARKKVIYPFYFLGVG